jgi:hypothetical protein
MQDAYVELKQRWLIGERDRELGLRLMFFAWMHWADPPFVTGLLDDPNDIPLWLEIFEYFGGEAASDAEFLYVTAIMASITPEELGGEDTWKPRVERRETRSKELRPEGFRPEDFERRGDYGEYFAHQSR